MIHIDELNVTVTVDERGDSGDAAFVRMFNRYIQQWWRETQSQAAREARAASERTLVPKREGDDR